MAIDKKLSRIFLKHIRRLRLLYFLIAIIFILTSLFFYIRTISSDQIINDFSTRRTEWTSSEHSPFFNWLIIQFNFEKIFEDKKRNRDIEKRMKKILKPVNDELDRYTSNLPNTESEPLNTLNIEKLTYEKIPYYLDDQRLKNLSLHNLNLTSENKTPKDWNMITPSYILRSKNDGGFKPQSFVFIPTQLLDMDEKNQCQLSQRLKRELVFSKFIEKYLREILNQIDEAKQAFFIPMSGFVRICQKGIDDPVEHYRNKLNFRQDFADRIYFKPTIKDKFHITPLYVDAGGSGIVSTYCAAVINKNWGIIGMIGVDIQVGLTEDTLPDGFHWLNPFSPPLIDFGDLKDLNGNTSLFQTKNKLLNNDDKKGILDYINAKATQNNEKKDSSTSPVMETTLNRFDFDVSGKRIDPHPPASAAINRTIYSLPLEGKKIAFFIFDKQRLMKQNIVFIAVLAILLTAVTLLIFFVYRQMIRRVSEEENKLELITQMHSSYVITDKNNHIQVCNKEFENLVEDKNAVGKNLEEYLTKDSMKDLKFFLDSGKERFECPVVIKRKSGTEKSAILINTQTSYHLDNKARISILIESENLESLVAEKYADRISHVLKSPLHSILQIADQLRRKTAKPRYDDYFKLLEVEIGGLKGEIARLLSMLKTEYKPTKPDYKKFDLTKLVKEIKDEYIPLLEKKKISFNSNFADGVTLTADRNMIKITIENILDNALKYTPSGSISFYLYDSPTDAKIMIEDTGIGIPGDEVDLIFLKGHRGKNSVVLESPGKGIGLYHCKNFIELHHGRINVESTVGKGSQFTILLPKNLEENRGE